ncbi:MAG TPA: glycoside hydrolase family 97 N-terminal domain-containing protein, partial [Ignavibacteriaceae bacterium]|nr:glycoside hydrolase family 97 N-terminal domain-containing protein [Ignavibacteriaceae bacterium]
MKLSLIFILLLTSQIILAQSINSPDGKLTLTTRLSGSGVLSYALTRDGKAVIKDSRLGIDLADQNDLMNGFVIDKIDTSTFYEQWNPVWGEVSTIVNHYRQLQVTLTQTETKRTVLLTFRLFNDGLGFRYEFPSQQDLTYFTVQEELTEFAPTGNHKTFWIPGDYDSQEYTYTTSLLSEVN